MREMTKSLLGEVVSSVDPQCRYDRAVFVLAHMRCGSTALSNILCSRPEISGYGEAHIAYRDSADLGRLVVNQALRRAWKPGARYMLDKLLHSRHDAAIPSEFFRSRAVFLCRRPEWTVPSIRRLFTALGKDEYATDAQAAEYYVERVTRLTQLWGKFSPDHRVGLTHEQLIGETDLCLERISALLRLDPPLKNAYRGHAAAVRGGGGDPTISAKRTKIEVGQMPASPPPMDLPSDLLRRANTAYERFVATVAKRATPR